MNKILAIIGGTIVAAVFTFLIITHSVDRVSASVPQGHEYQSTTTLSSFPDNNVVKSEGGTLGSVIITGATAGSPFAIYDATTTNVNLRTGNKATSSITIASFGTGYATGTYTFDSVFFTGLLVDIGTVIPTTTITYR